jgi:hypothetical protein
VNDEREPPRQMPPVGTTEGLPSRRSVRASGRRAAAAAVQADGPRRSRSERRGRTLLDGWIIAVGLVVLVAAGAAIGMLVRSGRAGSGAAGTKGSPTLLSAAPSGTEVAPQPSTVFATMKRFGVEIHFPAPEKQMVAVGFHQAWNTKATDFVPGLKVHPKDAYAKTKAALKADPSLRLFEMMARGRGSSEFSAADCAVKPGATILSPVTGKVTLITTYKLAGVGTDYRVEIAAAGASSVRVVLIHIKDIIVKEGERVDGGVTPIATVRHLPIDNQVNKYLPVAADHTHIQINAVGYKLNESS